MLLELADLVACLEVSRLAFQITLQTASCHLKCVSRPTLISTQPISALCAQLCNFQQVKPHSCQTLKWCRKSSQTPSFFHIHSFKVSHLAAYSTCLNLYTRLDRVLKVWGPCGARSDDLAAKPYKVWIRRSIQDEIGAVSLGTRQVSQHVFTSFTCLHGIC